MSKKTKSKRKKEKHFELKILHLNPPDFFLWGYLKDRVYAARPKSITELKEAIKEEIRPIPGSVCKDVFNNFVLRVKKCTELNGGYLKQML